MNLVRESLQLGNVDAEVGRNRSSLLFSANASIHHSRLPGTKHQQRFSTCYQFFLFSTLKYHVVPALKMVRTRAVKGEEALPESNVPSNQERSHHESNDGRNEAGSDVTDELHTAQEAPSFNGKLQKYQYASVTSTTTATSGRVSTSRVSTKRQLVTGNQSSSGSPAKKRRESSKYAPPEKYAHLSPLTDILEPGLICVFVGFNPGVRTATAGHAYAHPSNHFWKLLYSSGLTDRRCRPEEDRELPRLYSMGNTNIVSRPSKDVAELSKQEVVAGVPILDYKIRKYKPEAVCIVGKSIWEAIWQYHHGKKPSKAEFKYGWQDERHNMGRLPLDEGEKDDTNDDDWPGARVFVATSTSGLSATPKPAEKEAIWRPFGEWVQTRRQERAAQTTS